jgi:PAS domain S-box-containing protein
MADAVIAGDREGRFILANQAAGAMFGVPADMITGLSPDTQPWRVFDVDGNAIASEEKLMHRALAGETIAREHRVATPDGRELQVWAAAAPLRDEAGQITGAVVVNRDVTEERKRQQQAAQGEKLRALGQMAGGVAHDLNQYLGLVVGHGDLARQALSQAAPDLESVQESLDVMVRAAIDGATTVRRLLTLVRPREEAPSGCVELGGLLREVAQLTAPRWRDAAQAEGRPISLSVQVDGDTTIQGDPAGLREALTNLIFNAVDALPEGGAIVLEAARRGEQVEAIVKDSGIGMSQEITSRIFEPFFSTKGERGSGLGLAMVYGIVRQHDGQITLDSIPGRGTTFRLTFPAARADDLDRCPTESAAEVRPRRILVVDDEPRICLLASRILVDDGHQVATAASGEEALDRLMVEPFDLVLSDVGMGAGMNGWELAERVRTGFPGLRFALATGWAAEIDPDEAATRGVDAVLAKPYRLTELQRLVANLS